MSTKHIVLFSGGSGASELIKTLAKDTAIKLTVLVNCYDDGLSTGKLRACIPGMLGPSDVRKNVKHSLQQDNACFSGFNHIISFRFPYNISESAAMDYLKNISKNRDLMISLNDEQIGFLQSNINRFLQHNEAVNTEFVFDDLSLGNILFTGLYLRYLNFNETVRAFSEFFRIKINIINLTDGSDLKLLGITEDNLVLQKEAEICSLPHSKKIHDIFLFKRYLKPDEISISQNNEFEGNLEYLNTMNCFPAINPEACDSIMTADVLIYWPGTQHSSLFPSYLTDNLLETIAASRAEKKILVMNILKDHDIYNETAFSLIEKFFWFMSKKGAISYEPNLLVTDILLNKANSELKNGFLPLGKPNKPYPGVAIQLDDWSNSFGKHCVKKVLEY